MISNQEMNDVQAVFLADTHFHVERSAAEAERLEHCLALLEQVAGVPQVVLLGDIFDFWFDYPHFVMKGYDRLLTALDRVVDAGSRLHFVGGNHDIWAAEYLHRRCGSAAEGHAVTLDLDGQRVFCSHGDGLLGRDLLYKVFRAVVRHPAGVLLGKSLHPEALFAFSSWLSKTSRGSTRDEAEGIERKARRWLQRQQSPHWDHMIIGHVHHPFVAEHDQRLLHCLGGWFGDLHYAVWRHGRLEHRTWLAPGTTTDGLP